MNPRIKQWLEQTRSSSPVMVVDLEEVRRKYQELKRALKHIDIYYAVKANPEFDILRVLAREGASFDVASPEELDNVLLTGIDTSRISYGHTIKKPGDIAYAWQRGVRLFAFDSVEELEKIAKYAPHSKVFCRILVINEGACWPLSRKFGCQPEQAYELLLKAKELGLEPTGLSFHVGSQQENPKAFRAAIHSASLVYQKLKKAGVKLSMLNIGGGFPAKYQGDIPSYEDFGDEILSALDAHFGGELSQIITEPGRALVADAGILATEVVLVKHDVDKSKPRWVYLDVGYYGGLVELQDEAIIYRFQSDYDAKASQSHCILAGPTCDSVDMLYEKNLIALPNDLKVGDRLYLMSAGAYTSACATKNFNGMAGVRAVCLPTEEDMPLFAKKVVHLSEARNQRKKSLWG
ncbi:MAG: type III PLP-dependent enzyme [Alphaproteobacteria bacterium]